MALVDTGPLFAAADRSDRNHDRCLAALQQGFRLVIPCLVVAEASYMSGRELGPRAESAFLRGLGSLDVDMPPPDEWLRTGALAETYADFPLGGTDASIVAASERLNATTIITLDHRGFWAVKPNYCEAFTLLP